MPDRFVSVSAPVIAVVGPTATGKSELALDLAQEMGGEIVNADAMQLYRGMDIGTAKVPIGERRAITHHQLDVLDVTQDASVAAYQTHARADLSAIAARGRPAVVVGGSGLYVRALLDEMSFPGTDPDVRAALESRASEQGPGVLHDELTRADPAAAQRIDRANARRIVRALEVIELTGKPYSASLPQHRYHVPAIQVGLQVPREELNMRIAQRAQAMFDDGLLAETQRLLQGGLQQGKTASRAVGYAQAIDALQQRCTIAQAVESTTTATRQLASRQIKWFRRDPRITWLPAGPGALEQTLALVAES